MEDVLSGVNNDLKWQEISSILFLVVIIEN